MLTPWKKSYDQPRQHFKKQRYYFANKDPSSQSYGFSDSRVWIGHNSPSKEQASFNFMAAVTTRGDFGAPQNKVTHCFHHFPIYLPGSDGTSCHDLSFLNV